MLRTMVGGRCRFHLDAETLHHNYQQPKLSGTGLRDILGVAVVSYPRYCRVCLFVSGFGGGVRGGRANWANGPSCRAGCL